MIKHLPKFLLGLLMLLLSTINSVKAQSVSNEGAEFWSIFPTHVPNAPNGQPQLANISIFITGRQASSGTVSVGNYSQRFTVVANTVTEIPVPRNAAYINDRESGRVLTNRAIHILVDAGQPAVVVYSHIFAGARSAASLILPVKALGQQYYSMNYTQSSNFGGQNFITVIASEPNTKVFIKRGTTDLVAGGITLNNVGDVYEYLSNDDLTGVSVSVDPATSGCKRFAMFSGSSAATIEPLCTTISADPLYQQNYPIESWGRTYGFIPFSMMPPGSNVASERTRGNYIRVVAKDDNTTVQINGNTVATLNSGGFYSSPAPLSQPASISANKPISMAQYALTAGCAERSNLNNNEIPGDPDMVILNPTEYSIKNITVYSSTRESISEQYINVLIKTASASSFLINGRAPTTAFTPLTALPDYSYLQLNLNSYRTNNFNLTADDGFNAIAYGFGRVESYAYSAGTNLATTLTATAVDPVSNLSITSACVYDEYFLQLTLNVPTKKIVWTINPSNTVITQDNPVAKDTTINNQPYYIYKIPKPPVFNTAGVYTVNIIADLPPSTGGCTIGDQNFNFPFTVYSAPVTAFTMPASVCAGTEVSFADKSTDNGKTITSWIWTFGDGSTSTLQNPVHTYTAAGADTVSLTSVSESGCQSTTQQIIRINNLPVAAFTSINSAFKDFAVLLNDASTIATGNIVRWTWNFGDGKTEVHTNSRLFEHVYPAAGTYQVTLTVLSDQGCQNMITKSVIAIPANKPDFKLPEVCEADLSAQFFDLTADSISAGINLSYLWNFGDADATATNPNTSTEKNPMHRFSKAQIYQISLTVTSDDGSSATITKPFQVNGSMPKAAFNILSTANLCSTSPVTFENQSTVDVGTITKIEWYFDYQNQPNVKLTDEDPTPGKQYVYQYHSQDGCLFGYYLYRYNRENDYS